MAMKTETIERLRETVKAEGHEIREDGTVKVPCSRCGGSPTAFAWSRQAGGRCFKCGEYGGFVLEPFETVGRRIEARVKRAEKKEATRLARIAADEAAFAAYLADKPELAAAFAGIGPDDHILFDLRAKAARYRDLSEKQIALALKLHAEKTNPAKKGVAAEGRVEIEGRVGTLRWVEGFGRFGASTLKMLVVIDGADGEWRAWGTAPAAIADEVSKGDRVRFTATFEAKQGETDFAFFKRPTKAVVIAAANENGDDVAA